MIKRIIFLFMLLFSHVSISAGITDGKFGINQIFDVQYWWNGTTLNASNFIAPYDMNWGNPSLSSGQYFAFFPSTTNPGKYGLGVYNSNGTRASIVHNFGDITALGNGAIFYIGSGFFGNVITTSAGYSYGQSAQFTNMDTSVTASDLTNYTFASTTPLSAGQTAAPVVVAPTVTNTTTAQVISTTVSGNTTYKYTTPVTTKTWSDGTTTTENGTPMLVNTAVASTVTTTKVNGSTLTTYNTPILTNTPADGSASFISANGQQTSTSQQVQQGLNYKVYDFDAYTYTCTIFGCAKNLLGPYRVPSLTPGTYNQVATGKTSGGVYVPTNGSFPAMGDGTLVAYNGTLTVPITTTRTAGTIYRIYFYSNNDDGFVMKINGHTVINDQSTFQLQALGNGYTSNGWMDLVAGQTYNFEAWYWNDTGGYGLNLKWDIGGGRVEIPNSAFTTGTLNNVAIDTTGLAYSNDTIVPVAGLCCGGSAVPFDADITNTAKVLNFVNRTSADSQVYIEQIGTQNTVEVTQSGTRNNYAKYVGNGFSNDITIDQKAQNNSQTNYVDLAVTGNFNTVEINQRTTTQTNSFAKGAFVNITGNNNSLLLDQKDGGSHYAEVNLSGGNKNVDITQQGSAGHMAKITLSGAPTDLSLTQSGNIQNHYSITHNCTTAGGCAKITVNQGQ